MFLRLQNYDIDLQYRPGSSLVLADTLSRAAPTHSERAASDPLSEEVASVREVERADKAASDYIVASPLVQNMIRSAAATDQTYTALRAQIRAGWPDKQSLVSAELRQFFPFADELAVENDLIFKGTRLYVPESAQPEMIKRAHSSHIGLNACIRRAKEAIYFPGLTAEITKYVN